MATRRVFPVVVLVLLVAWVERAVCAGGVLLTRDLSEFFIPDAAEALRQLRNGRVPLWNPLLRCGQPLLATWQSQVLHPPRLLALLLTGDPGRAVSVQAAGELLVAGLWTFLLARTVGLRQGGALLAAIVAVAGGTLAGLASQLNVASAAAWAPGVLVMAMRLQRAPSGRRAGLLALVVAVEVLAGSPETLLWLAPFTLCTLAFSPSRARGWPLLVAAGTVGVLLAAPTLVPALELLAASTRHHGEFFANTAWAFRLGDLAELATPFGRNLQVLGDAYYGQQHFVTSTFIGTAASGLALAGLRPLWRRFRGGVVAGVLCLLSALGALPATTLFRYPAKFFPAVALVLALAAGAGLQRVEAAVSEGVIRRRLKLLFAAAVLLAAPVLRPGLPALGLAWVGAVLFLGGVVIQLGRGVRQRTAWSLLLLASAELLVEQDIAPVHITAAAPEPPSPLVGRVPVGTRVSTFDLDPTAVAQFLAGRFETDGVVRAFEVPAHGLTRDVHADWMTNTPAQDGVPRAEGYGEPEPWPIARMLEPPVPPQVFDLLDVGLFIRRAAPPYPGAVAVESPRPPVLLFVPPHPPTRTWLVPCGAHVEVLAQEAAIARVRTDGFDPHVHAVLDHWPGCTGNPGAGTAQVIDERPDRVLLSADAKGEAILVLADAAYPGWELSVDGVAQPGFTVDGVVRGARLSAGAHQVQWRYRPDSWRWGLWLFGAGALGLVLFLFGPNVLRVSVAGSFPRT